MAVGGILATALTTHAAHPIGLFVDNVDYIAEQGAVGTNFGVTPEDLELEEQGPDGVSSLTFTIDDPSNEIVITEAQIVRMHDFTADLPLFLGFVQDWTYRVWGLGRRIDVRCIGIEAVLDWAVVGTYTLTATNTDFWGDPGTVQNPIQGAIQWPGYQLRIAFSQVPNPNSSSVATPIAYEGGFSITVTLEGQTLRESLRLAYASAPSVQTQSLFMFTADFYGNLRGWYTGAGDMTQSRVTPSDYADLTVVDTTAGNPASSDLAHETDVSAAGHRVWVNGFNAAGTGLYWDGSTLPGAIAYITDDTSTSTVLRDQIAVAYLTDRRVRTRGSFGIEDWQPLTNIRAGSRLILTDAILGISAVQYRIMSIRKTFHGTGRQDWTVTYGGLPPAATTLMRRLTRDTRS